MLLILLNGIAVNAEITIDITLLNLCFVPSPKWMFVDWQFGHLTIPVALFARISLAFSRSVAATKT